VKRIRFWGTRGSLPVILSNMARIFPRSTDSSTPGVPSASCTCVEAKISNFARYCSVAISA